MKCILLIDFFPFLVKEQVRMSLTGVQVIREYIFFVVQKLERGEMIKWIRVSRTYNNNKKSLINLLPISNNTFTSLRKNRKERERKEAEIRRGEEIHFRCLTGENRS